MTDPSSPAGLLAALGVLLVVALLVTAAWYVWTGIAFARLFRRVSVEPWRGWVPGLNLAEVLALGGSSRWWVLLLVVPVIGLYALVLYLVAAHRVGRLFGRGAGATVLAVLVPPLWATVLGWSRVAPGAGRGGTADAPTRAVDRAAAAPIGPLAGPAGGHALAASPRSVAPGSLITAPPASAPTSSATAPAPVETLPLPPATVAAPVAAPAARSMPSAPAPASVAGPLPANPWAPEPVAAPSPEAGAGRRADAPSFDDLAVEIADGATVLRIDEADLHAAASRGGPIDAAPLDAHPLDPDALDPDVEATVVVDRRPRIAWRLRLDDGSELGLHGERILLGRNPGRAETGEQRLAVPDSTRTLSKTHARLELIEGRWWITDLDSTNGVLIGADEAERLADPRVPTPVPDRFVLGRLGMRIAMEHP